MPIQRYYLGCPGWGMKSWVGRLFPPGTKDRDFLARYAEVFNTVEGNTTFYALPTSDSVARWRDSVPDTFRFCFKFPRTISHDKQLVDCAAEVNEFLARIAPLGEKLGTLMLQLPPRFRDLARLRTFVDELPRELTYAVELRHEVFFAAGPEEDDAMALLRERNIDLVIMDTRGVHASKSLEFAEVRGKKPALPVVLRATSTQPIVRCVPHEVFAETLPFLQIWPGQVARWIGEGKRPYFFMHAPDDTYAPENAYAFHALLRDHADVGELPVWPSTPAQLGLF